MNENKKRRERPRGEIRPPADPGSAAEAQFPEPDGWEVESSTAGRRRVGKKNTCIKRKTCSRADGINM